MDNIQVEQNREPNMCEGTCCCYIPIRAGVIVIGIMGLFGGVNLILRGILHLIFSETPDEDENREVFAAYHLLLGVIYILINIVVLKGVYSSKVPYIRSWVIANYILLAMATGASLIFAGYWSINIPEIGPAFGLIFLMVAAVHISVYNYFIKVVARYANILQAQEEGNREPHVNDII